MRFNEQEPVRLRVPVRGEDVYTGETEDVPAGHIGAVVVATEGVSVYQVDFTIEDPDGDAHTAVLVVDESLLAPA
jgi:hypothetical protein